MIEPVENLLNKLFDTAEKNLIRDGNVMPVFFTGKLVPEYEDGCTFGIIGFPPELLEPHNKPALKKSIAAIARNYKADFLIYISEAWLAAYPKGANIDKVTPVRNRPEKREVIIATYATIDGDSGSLIGDIDRSGKIPCTKSREMTRGTIKFSSIIPDKW